MPIDRGWEEKEKGKAWWEYPLMPFQWIQEHAIEPFAATVTAPWSPSVAGAENQGWLSRQLAEYKAWDAPWGVKGLVETLPWFAIPSAAGVAGRLGGLAAKGGMFGRAAEIGATALKPAVLAERALAYPVTKLLGSVGTRAGRLVPQIVKTALKKTEGMVGAGAKKVAEVADPLMDKMGNLMRTATKATEITGKARTLEFSARAAEQKKWLDIAAKAATPKEMNDALAKASAARAGIMPTTTVGEYRFLEALKSGKAISPEDLGEIISPDDIFQARQKILQSDLMPYQKTKLAKETLNKFLSTTETLQPSELKLLKQVFPQAEEINALKTQIISRGGKKAWETFTEVINIPRATMTSADLSATFRQCGMGITRFPDDLVPMLEVEAKVWADPKKYTRVMEALESHPDYLEWAERMGIGFSPAPGAGIALTKEEYYMGSNILYRLPGIKQTVGKVVAASERAFTGAINYMRASEAEYYYNLTKALITKSPNLAIQEDAMLKYFGKLVMASTGRGSLPKALQSASPLLNAFFFAPRWVASRLEIPLLIARPGVPWAARKEAIRMLTQFMSAGAGILGAAHLAGAKITVDPRSSDFGKIIIGNTRLDIWAGYAQWIRLTSQLAAGQRVTVSGEKVKARRSDIVWNFLQSKEAPLASVLTDLLTGETFLGEPLFEGTTTIAGVKVPQWSKTLLFERFTPLFAQDLLDAIETDGMFGSLYASPSFMGVGAISYKEKPTPMKGLPQLPSLQP